MQNLPESVINVINKFEHSGFFACVGGGTVRELLMDETPAVYIIITDAPREIIRAMFRKNATANDKKNYYVIIENKIAFEIHYTKTRDGNEIKNILSEFDFTINSIGYNHKTGFIDYFNGLNDFENKVIRFTGNIQISATEKPSRLIRAVRYSAQLGFELSEDTKQDIKRCSVLIKRAQNDRIREEIEKLLISYHPEKIMLLNELGLLRYIMPELDICFEVPQRNKYHIYNVGEHIVHAVCEIKNEPILRWAALLHDVGKPECKSVDANGIIHFYGHHRESVRLASGILRRMRMNNEMTRDILILVENHDVRIEPSIIGVKRMMARTGADLFLKLLEVQEADNRAKNMKFFRDKLNKLNDLRRIYNKVIAERQPYRVSDLAINARDLNKVGFRPGHETSEILQKLLEEVLIDQGLNNREYLLAKAKNLRKKKS